MVAGLQIVKRVSDLLGRQEVVGHETPAHSRLGWCASVDKFGKRLTKSGEAHLQSGDKQS